MANSGLAVRGTEGECKALLWVIDVLVSVPGSFATVLIGHKAGRRSSLHNIPHLFYPAEQKR